MSIFSPFALSQEEISIYFKLNSNFFGISRQLNGNIDNDNLNLSAISQNLIFTGNGLSFGEISAVDNSTETTISVAGTAVQVTIFDTNGESNNTTPDHTNDHITITSTGKYLITCSATVNSVAGAASRMELSVQKNNGDSIVIPTANINLAGGGGETTSIDLTGIASLTADDTIEVWIENETNTQNYVVENISLSLVQIGG